MSMLLQKPAADTGVDAMQVDFMLDQGQRPGVIEVNTVPAMTHHRMVPMAARAAGLEVPDPVLGILAATLAGDDCNV